MQPKYKSFDTSSHVIALSLKILGAWVFSWQPWIQAAFFSHPNLWNNVSGLCKANQTTSDALINCIHCKRDW